MQAHYVQTQVSETQAIDRIAPNQNQASEQGVRQDRVRKIEKIAQISTSSINVIIEHNL